jgi:hypothetical protein
MWLHVPGGEGASCPPPLSSIVPLPAAVSVAAHSAGAQSDSCAARSASHLSGRISPLRQPDMWQAWPSLPRWAEKRQANAAMVICRVPWADTIMILIGSAMATASPRQPPRDVTEPQWPQLLARTPIGGEIMETATMKTVTPGTTTRRTFVEALPRPPPLF